MPIYNASYGPTITTKDLLRRPTSTLDDEQVAEALTGQAALLDQPFAIEAANPGRNGAAAWQTENIALFAKYAGEFRGNANSQQGSVGLRVTW